MEGREKRKRVLLVRVADESAEEKEGEALRHPQLLNR